MPSPFVKHLFAAVAVATLSIGAAHAAPVTRAIQAPEAHATAQALVQPVHWEYHHHRKVWVRDRRH